MNCAEAHCLAALDAGHHQGALAVFALQVDGQAEIGVRRRDALGLPSTSAKCRFMFGNFLTACTSA